MIVSNRKLKKILKQSLRRRKKKNLILLSNDKLFVKTAEKILKDLSVS